MITFGDSSVASCSAALVDAANGSITYHSELLRQCDEYAALLGSLPRPNLAFLVCTNGSSDVRVYLSCLRGRIPLGLVEAKPELLNAVIATFSPSTLFLPKTWPVPDQYEEVDSVPGDRLRLCQSKTREAYQWPISDRLALLLTTSGSTGNPKLVQLSLENLVSNATAIAKYLCLTSDERCIQSLPLHYSYGLSL